MKFRFHLIVLLMSAVAQMAVAQNSAPVRLIKGSVLDTSGAVIPGADVAVTTKDGRTIAQGVTDSAGNFSFSDLPAGSYVVDVTKQGFREIRQEAKVGSITHQQLRVVLPVATVTQEVTVGASDSGAALSTEISQNQSSNSIDRDALDRIPVFDQDYITTMSRFLDADATGTNGVTLVVNGVEANGPGVTAECEDQSESIYGVVLEARPGADRDHNQGGNAAISRFGKFPLSRCVV
jgi:Carboxypeptidase regulatory-like domain